MLDKISPQFQTCWRLKQLLKKYGDLDRLRSRAKSPRELEAMLMELKGVKRNMGKG